MDSAEKNKQPSKYMGKSYVYVLVLGATLALSACAPGQGQGTFSDIFPGKKTQQEKPQQTTQQTTGPQAPTQTAPGARPPQLPSLEDLLARMPRPDKEYKIPPPLPISDNVRVALLLPLSGANERIGNAMLGAAQMALFDFAPDNFEIIIRDTQGTPEGATEAARLAIGDGASAIIGPLLSSSIGAVAPQARAANIPIIGFSSDRRVVGGGVYTMGFFPEDEVRRVVQYAMTRGHKSFALLAPDDPYGAAVAGALDLVTSEYGAFVVARELYDPSTTDFSKVVRRIADYDIRHARLVELQDQYTGLADEASIQELERLKNLQTIGEPPFDALLLADGDKRLIEIAALLPFYDVDPAKVKILGTGLWDEPSLGAEPALLNGWFAAPDPKGRLEFFSRYKRTFNAQPHRLTTLAYDALAVAIVLSREKQNPFAATRITQSGGFIGRDGVFRFRPDGLVERGLAVLRVGKKDPTTISPAPSKL